MSVHLATLVEKGGDRAWREQSAAGGDCSDRIHDLGRGLRLVDERARARLDGRKASGVAVFSGKEDELGVGADLTDSQPCVCACSVGQAEVDECDVGHEVLGAGDRVGHRSCAADHRHVGLIVQQGREAVGHHLVIFDDQDSNLLLAQSGKGTQNSTLVPAPGSLVTSHQPPASSARS